MPLSHPVILPDDGVAAARQAGTPVFGWSGPFELVQLPDFLEAVPMRNTEEPPVLFVRRPKERQWQAVQVGGKRNDFGSGVKHHSANPTFARRIGHRLQTPDIASAQGAAGFYFHPHQSPGAIFEHDVDFLSGSCPLVEELRLALAPGGLFAQFHQHKILEHSARQCPVDLQPLHGQSQ